MVAVRSGTLVLARISQMRLKSASEVPHRRLTISGV
jgi:hypothetical protein